MRRRSAMRKPTRPSMSADFDTAHKLSLLTTLAFGTQVAFDQVHVEGIESDYAG